jgi:exo-beta-1,3-glucanase (GH17 family)/cellulose synthase/poly-beta-1,6-N-acetylglucosamine synthase-like glycosyltransferase
MTESFSKVAAFWQRPIAAWVIAALIVALNFSVWRFFNPPHFAPDVSVRVQGLAYNAFQRWDSPLAQRFPERDALISDLKLLAQHTGRLRTYSATELPDLPQAATHLGLKVTLGAWIDQRWVNNQREISAAIKAAQRHASIERLVIGNETQFHQKISARQLYSYLDRVRAEVGVPVSTAEPWHVWLAQPELARHVDFITVHLLPYWEKVPVTAAVDEAFRRLEEVRARFPRKPIVIGEIGWPSGGDALGDAEATPAAQALFIREFLSRAQQVNLDYFLMEAIDQPWKVATEGVVGAHWGLWDAARQQKFSFQGAIEGDPHWVKKAIVSSVMGLIAVLPFLFVFRRMRLAGRIAFSLTTQGVASCAVLLMTLPLANYLSLVDTLVWLGLLPALVIMAAILLAQAFEFSELYWPGSLGKRVLPKSLPQEAAKPMVSIHLACSNEPPAMVIAAIESLLKLEWPAYEILVVDNNTQDPALWQPVQDFIQNINASAIKTDSALSALPRLTFIHLPQWPGFKAGALNVALAQTDPRAEWIALVDADYLVMPDWLYAIAGYFPQADVGLVQTPQAHRDFSSSALSRMMNWEYEGFFRVGMHHRHERNAIVQHGTMTVIRADVMRDLGGWDTRCICEDTELGLRILQQGFRAVYVDQALGAGLVPADFSAYRRQRRRWAQGAMQILRTHWRALMGRSSLTWGQRYHFVAGWLPWVGDALHLLFTLAAIGWTLGILIAPEVFGFPIALFILPLAIFFSCRLLLAPLLYSRHVRCGAADTAGAALAGMGLSHVIARGIFAGLLGQRSVFEITRKHIAALGAQWPENSESVPPASTTFESVMPHLRAVREELLLFAGLIACAFALLLTRAAVDAVGLDALWMWIAVLMMQALPYAAAVGCAWISFNGRPKPYRALPAPSVAERKAH